MSARSAVAQQRGATEDLIDSVVDDHQSSALSPVQLAALRLADAYLAGPAAMTEADRNSIAEHLTEDQIVEIVLKLTGYSSDKVMVALGLDFDEVDVFIAD